MSYDTSYGLGYAADTYGDNATTVDSKYVVGLAAKSLGWRNHFGDIVRVRASVGTGWDWTVWVHRIRAEEFARELWKDSRTRKVTIELNDFPKPAEKTVADVEKEFEAFKKKVVEVALRTRGEEDWCRDGFNRAMRELGLPTLPAKIRVVLEIDAIDNPDLRPDIDSAGDWLVNGSATYANLADSVTSVEPVEG